MANDIDFDITDLTKGLEKLSKIDISKPINDVANEVLRLSMFEVPHDKGLLQASGTVEPTSDPTDVIVGYNKVYAARLHEHPEYRFQKGRKGKYLEDPIKNNLALFQQYISDGLNSLLA